MGGDKPDLTAFEAERVGQNVIHARVRITQFLGCRVKEMLFCRQSGKQLPHQAPSQAVKVNGIRNE